MTRGCFRPPQTFNIRAISCVSLFQHRWYKRRVFRVSESVQNIRATMKVILVTLALLLLVVHNEGLGLTPAKIPTKLILKKPEVTKSCPRNPKLEAMRKALGLATKRRGRGKRSVSKYLVFDKLETIRKYIA